MSQQNDFFSFEEALDNLRLKEEELKRLVSEGEIRAFREGDTMKLRRTDVEQLKTELMGGEVVELGDGGADLVFEDDFEDPGMATEELSAADTLLDEDLGVLDEIDDTEFEAEEETELPSAAPAPQEKDNPLVLAASLGMLVLLIVGAPVLISASTGNMSDFAKGVAGIFVQFEEE